MPWTSMHGPPMSEAALANIEPSTPLDPPANLLTIHAATELHAMDRTEGVADLAGTGVHTPDLAGTGVRLHLHIGLGLFFFGVGDVQVPVDVDTRTTAFDGTLDHIDFSVDFSMALDLTVAAIQLPSVATVA